MSDKDGQAPLGQIGLPAHYAGKVYILARGPRMAVRWIAQDCRPGWGRGRSQASSLSG